MRNAKFFLLILTASLSAPVQAQAVPTLTGGDSVSIRVASLRALFQLLRIDATSLARIWIVTHEGVGYGPMRVGQVPLTEREHAAIRSAYPGARTAIAMDSVIQCPPGVELMMPIRGCPIRDDGIVVRFIPFNVDGDTIRTGGEVIQSRPGGYPTHSWAAGMSLLFVRVGRDWILRAGGFYWET
jgi:hypothetical protein